jgi:hypothetical protein
MRTVLVGLAAASFCAWGANAAAEPNCGMRVVNDWYEDGRIGRLYPLPCYQQALEALPVDTASTVRADIVRARTYAERGRLAPPSAAWRARRAADRVYRAWNAAVRAGAIADPGTRFRNPPVAELRRRLKIAARRYGFEVTQLYVKWPRQQAPYLVVRASHPRAFAGAMPSILRSLDPKRDTGDDRTGWAYEGFYLEARDRSGTPFLVVFNHWRGNHGGGGQWARSAELYPFAHG